MTDRRDAVASRQTSRLQCLSNPPASETCLASPRRRSDTVFRVAPAATGPSVTSVAATHKAAPACSIRPTSGSRSSSSIAAAPGPPRQV